MLTDSQRKKIGYHNSKKRSNLQLFSRDYGNVHRCTLKETKVNYHPRATERSEVRACQSYLNSQIVR